MKATTVWQWLPAAGIWFIIALMVGLMVFFGKPINEELQRLRYLREGQLLLQEQRYNAAFTLYKEANQRYPAEPTFHLKLARLYHQQRQNAAAQRHYEQALASQQLLPLGDGLNLARFYVSERQYNKAFRLWRKLIETHGKKVPDIAYLDMASLYQELGVKAQLGNDDPSGKWLLRWSAYYYGLVAKKHDGQHYNALLGLGQAYHHLNEPTKAVGLFCKAHQLKPDAAVAQFNLGVALVQANQLYPGLVWMWQGIHLAEQPTSSDAEQAQATEWSRQWQVQRQAYASQAPWPPPTAEAFRPETLPPWLSADCLPPASALEGLTKT